jgi:general stress protein 26
LVAQLVIKYAHTIAFSRIKSFRVVMRKGIDQIHRIAITFILRICNIFMVMKIIDASEPEFGGPMTEDEVKDFLINSKKNVHISTLDEKHEPNIHPSWYFFDDVNNKLYLESGRDSRKTQNIRRRNIMYYCIDDDNIPYNGVRGKGIATISENINFNLTIIKKILVKYLASLEHPMSQTIMTNIKRGDAIILEITPKFYSTWDHAKGKKPSTR